MSLYTFFLLKSGKSIQRTLPWIKIPTSKQQCTCQNTSPHCTICSTCQTWALRLAYSNSQIHIFLSPPFCAINFVGECTSSLKCIHMSELQVWDSIPATHISRHINSITQVRQLILVNLLLHIKPGLSTTVNNGLYVLRYCLESSSYLDVKKCMCHQLQPFQNSCVHSFYGIS